MTNPTRLSSAASTPTSTPTTRQRSTTTAGFSGTGVPSHEGGYRALLAWMRSHGRIVAIGVESSGAFGRRSPTRPAGEDVVEVNKPNRHARHMDGKSDRLDAEQIARSVLTQTGIATPKSKSGPVEVIRTLRVARASAVRARTQAFNNLFGT